jgi:hypothetical protein
LVRTGFGEDRFSDAPVFVVGRFSDGRDRRRDLKVQEKAGRSKKKPEAA